MSHAADWTLDLAHATATHFTGVTVVALPAGRDHRRRVVPLADTLPAPGPGLSDEDCAFLAELIGARVREGGRLLLGQLGRRRGHLH